MRKPVPVLAAMLLLAGCAPYASVGYGTGYNGFNVGTGVNLYPGGYYGAPGFGSGAKRFFGTLGGAALGGWAGSGIGGGTGSWRRSGRERCWARSWDRASAVRLTARTRFTPGRPPPKPMRRRSARRSSGAIPIAAMREPSGRPARVGPRQAPTAAIPATGHRRWPGAVRLRAGLPAAGW